MSAVSAHSVRTTTPPPPPPPSFGWEEDGGVEPPTKLSKRGSLRGLQL